MKSIRPFLADESGATAVEYALVLAGISIAITSAMAAMSEGIANTMNTLSNTLG